MAGNWMDERERQWRERDWRRSGETGRAEGREDRSWDRDDRADLHGGGRGPERGPERGQDRDRVFGEGETGAGYGGRTTGGARSEPARGEPARRGWQDRDYGGVSPAMRQGAYDRSPRFTSQDYTQHDYGSGGRFYGDDDQERIYREEYGQGGVEYGDVPRGYDAQRSPTRERYHAEGYGQSGYGAYPGEYRQEMRKPSAGGTGGYDYERGYGDGGRRETRSERFEDAGRGAGSFLRHAGERVASWFGAGSESRIYDPDFQGRSRGARGLGPQGYKRSDDRISDDAHERLTDDTWLDATNISISVSGGEVTLSGTVENREAKHRAERLVEDISGVNHVQNNLRIVKVSFLRSDSTGYGDSVAEAQMRRDDPASTGTGGAGGGQSTAGKKN
jgi:osmotically-inducible protein OsmY